MQRSDTFVQAERHQYRNDRTALRALQLKLPERWCDRNKAICAQPPEIHYTVNVAQNFVYINIVVKKSCKRYRNYTLCTKWTSYICEISTERKYSRCKKAL